MGAASLTVAQKELIALGIGLAVRCENCIYAHVRSAALAGATREQIIEAAGVAVLMQGGPTYTYLPRVIEALDAVGLAAPRGASNARPDGHAGRGVRPAVTGRQAANPGRRADAGRARGWPRPGVRVDPGRPAPGRRRGRPPRRPGHAGLRDLPVRCPVGDGRGRPGRGGRPARLVRSRWHGRLGGGRPAHGSRGRSGRLDRAAGPHRRRVSGPGRPWDGRSHPPGLRRPVGGRRRRPDLRRGFRLVRDGPGLVADALEPPVGPRPVPATADPV